MVNMKKILVPLPAYGFDPTEVAIPWKLLSLAGIEMVFATPSGEKAAPDIRMLKGTGLGIWKSVLRARQDAVDACEEMQSSQLFSEPLKYSDINEHYFDALLLPGGHDKGVREYLESQVLQTCVVNFFVAKKLLPQFVMEWYWRQKVLIQHQISLLFMSTKRLHY
jgi:protease I